MNAESQLEGGKQQAPFQKDFLYISANLTTYLQKQSISKGHKLEWNPEMKEWKKE